MKKIFCEIGLHNWSNWKKVRLRDIFNNEGELVHQEMIQVRVCYRCNLIKHKIDKI